MLPYAAYLRVYEPISAFGAAESRRWASYAASPNRPRRAAALEAEQAEALNRLIAVPPISAPEHESEHAYVRWADGVTYICPWQTRLRSWLALTRFRGLEGALVEAAFGADETDRAAGEFASWQGDGSSLRVFIQACTWSVPPAWFVPFSAEERWLVLGNGAEAADARRAKTASGTRTLLYATAMSQARRRVARALGAARRIGGGALTEEVAGTATAGGAYAEADLAQIGRWLEEFHPHSLVELDYGGLVHLLDDDALRADQSVAEVGAAISATHVGEPEAAASMFRRLRERWQVLEDLEAAN
ncbi:MAG TPA: hypothetical protein VG253_14820 [Streptosporangiaceae bacterium]|nr:hypothetical protein [Streptosporangiaceae bacterium]